MSISVVETNRIPSLVRWGITPDGDLIYRTLVAYGPQQSSGLARDLGISVRRVDEALSQLAEADAVAVSGRGRRGPWLWQARPVNQVLDRLSANRVRPSLPRADVARRAAAVVANLPLTASHVRLGNGLRYLPSRELTRQRLAGLVKVAEHEHLAMNPEMQFDGPTRSAGTSMDHTLLDRGVQLRVLGVQPTTAATVWHDDSGRASFSPLYRAVAEVPMKLIVMDRRIAFFPVDPLDHDRGYLEVSHSPVVSALVAMFERQWACAQEVTATMSPITLSPREHLLIRLLAEGHTDAGAARSLRISERSVSNILRSLMDRLGVDNRFQLGLALGAMGVAPPAAEITESE